jgi:zinc protease
LEELDRVAREGITPGELVKAKAQLRARLVFENDSVTNIAHQLGYFATIAAPEVFRTATATIAAVSLDEVAGAAKSVLTPSNRTVGWFEPLPIAAEGQPAESERQ